MLEDEIREMQATAIRLEQDTKKAHEATQAEHQAALEQQASQAAELLANLDAEKEKLAHELAQEVCCSNSIVV